MKKSRSEPFHPASEDTKINRVSRSYRADGTKVAPDDSTEDGSITSPRPSTPSRVSFSRNVSVITPEVRFDDFSSPSGYDQFSSQVEEYLTSIKQKFGMAAPPSSDGDQTGRHGGKSLKRISPSVGILRNCPPYVRKDKTAEIENDHTTLEEIKDIPSHPTYGMYALYQSIAKEMGGVLASSSKKLDVSDFFRVDNTSLGSWNDLTATESLDHATNPVSCLPGLSMGPEDFVHRFQALELTPSSKSEDRDDTPDSLPRMLSMERKRSSTSKEGREPAAEHESEVTKDPHAAMANRRQSSTSARDEPASGATMARSYSYHRKEKKGVSTTTPLRVHIRQQMGHKSEEAEATVATLAKLKKSPQTKSSTTQTLRFARVVKRPRDSSSATSPRWSKKKKSSHLRFFTSKQSLH